MEPLSTVAFAVASIAVGLSNLWNGWQTRKQTLVLEEKRAAEKRINDRESFERTKSLQEDVHKRSLQLQQNNFHNELIKNEIKINYDTLQIWTKRGDWLKTVRPNEKRPIVIFDTMIGNNTTNKDEFFTFNPMESLYHSFENQIRTYLPNEVYITNISKLFKSKAAIEAFYNDEFFDLPVIIVYGSFDGSFLRINAVYAGMTIEQHIFDSECRPQVLANKTEHLCLAAIPTSMITKTLENEEKASAKFLFREQIQEHIINLISNTSLQSLIDNHFSIHKSGYLPIVGVYKSLEQLEKIQIGLQTEDIKKSIEMHHNMLKKQLEEIQTLRVHYMKEYFKKNY